MRKYKQDSPAVKKAEEKLGDLDGDGEANEDPKHKAKVRKATKAMAKGSKALPPAFLANTKTAKGKGKGNGPAQLGGEIPSGGLKSTGKAKKGGIKPQMCPDCVKSGAKSCKH